MAHTLLSFYKKNCGTKNILFKNKKVIYHLFSKGSIIVAILLGLNILWVIQLQELFRCLMLPVWVVIIVTLLFWFNSVAKKQLNDLFGFECQTFGWNSSGDAFVILSREERRLLGDFISKQHITKEQLESFRGNMDKELEPYKPKLASVPNICGTMFIALYSAMIIRLMNLATSFEEIKITVTIGVMLILTLGGLAWLIKSVKDAVLNSDFFSKDYKVLLKCMEIVDEIIAEQHNKGNKL